MKKQIIKMSVTVSLIILFVISLAGCNLLDFIPARKPFSVEDIASFKETFLHNSSGYTFILNTKATEREGNIVEMSIDEKYEASTTEQGDKLQVITRMKNDSSNSDTTVTKYYTKGLSHMHIGEFVEMPPEAENGYSWYIKTMEDKEDIVDLQTAKTPQVLLFLEKKYYKYDATNKKFFVNDKSGMAEQIEDLINTNNIDIISSSLELKNGKQEVVIKFEFKSEEYSMLEYTITIKNLQNTKVTLPEAYDGTDDRLENFVLSIKNTNDYVVSINYYSDDELTKTEKREKLRDNEDNGTIYYSLETNGVKTFSKEMFVLGEWRYFDYINNDWVERTGSNAQTEDIFSYDYLGGYMLVDSMSFVFIPINLNYKLSNDDKWSPDMQKIYFPLPTSYMEALVNFETAQGKGNIVLKSGNTRIEITLLSTEIAIIEGFPPNRLIRDN